MSHAISTREQVASLLASGHARGEIARLLGVSKATVSYHARRLGETIDERCARRYDWATVQAHYDAGNGVRACISRFGFSSASWFQAVKRGEIAPRPSRMAITDLLVANTYRGREYLKLRLIREGFKQARCERCGIDSWRDQALSLALHHINGARDDNRLENLELLCPNCHSQTANFAGRNRRRPTGTT
jgi:DNA-binding transcriptional ArsR family regulator